MFAKFTLYTKTKLPVYINPEKVESICSSKEGPLTGTCIALSGEDNYFIVEESVEDVARLLESAQYDRYRQQADVMIYTLHNTRVN